MMVLKGGMSNTGAEKELQVNTIASCSKTTSHVRLTQTKQGTVSSDKNEILFKRFGINYNNEPEMFKKGSVVYRGFQLEDLPVPASSSSKSIAEPEQHENSTQDNEISRTQHDKLRKLRQKADVVVEHVDIIKDEFWQRRPWILSNTPGRLPG